MTEIKHLYVLTYKQKWIFCLPSFLSMGKMVVLVPKCPVSSLSVGRTLSSVELMPSVTYSLIDRQVIKLTVSKNFIVANTKFHYLWPIWICKNVHREHFNSRSPTELLTVRGIHNMNHSILSHFAPCFADITRTFVLTSNGSMIANYFMYLFKNVNMVS